MKITYEDPIQSILNLRYLIDHNTQLVGLLTKSPEKSREISLAYTNLQESKMFLGKVLKALGQSTPYPDSKNPANNKIEPTADRAPAPEFEAGLSHVGKVKYLRGELEFIENQLKAVYDFGLLKKAPFWEFPFWALEYLLDSIKRVILSGMWLGMELANHYQPAKGGE